MSGELVVNQVAFEDGGIAIQYVDSNDIRVGGKVMVAKQISISSAHADYDEDMEELYTKTLRLLTNVLEDFAVSDVFDPSDDEDDDDIKGMGDR